MAELRVTFLGTGTSHGVPVIGCACAVCRSTDPRDKRTRCSVYVETPEMAVVIDTGPDFRMQCLREGVSRLDAIFYTHPHTDHIMGFDDLRRFCDVLGGPIPVYGSRISLEKIRHCFDFAFSGMNVPGYVHPDPREVTGPFLLGDTRVVPVPLEHGRLISTGYLFERGGRRLFAYLTDCKVIPERSYALVEGVEVVVLDALRWRPHYTHMHFEEALEAAERIGARQTYFTHLCHEVPHAAGQEMRDGIDFAYDGMRLIFE